MEHGLLQRLLKEASTSDQDGLPLLQSCSAGFGKWKAEGGKGKLGFSQWGSGVSELTC